MSFTLRFVIKFKDTPRIKIDSECQYRSLSLTKKIIIIKSVIDSRLRRAGQSKNETIECVRIKQSVEKSIEIIGD